jgi:hypothetical protein
MGTVSWLKGEWFAPDFSENEILFHTKNKVIRTEIN